MPNAAAQEAGPGFCHGSGGPAIQGYAKANAAEAKMKYKKNYDESAIVNVFQEGEEVLMKRTHGKFPKIAPNSMLD